MNPLLPLAFVLALVASVALAGVYLTWPRPMTVDEWITRRRASELGRRSSGSGPRWLGWVTVRLRWAVAFIRADLALLRSQGAGSNGGEDELALELVRLGALSGAIGLLLGLALWLVSGHRDIPWSASLLAVVLAVLLPAVRLLRFRRQANAARAAIRRRLPRVLTGSRVLLESGGLTPQRSLTTTVAICRDAAANVLREALRECNVRGVELQIGLDSVARRYDLELLQRLADAFRVGTRFGTEMADLLSEFAVEVRHGSHDEYRERMTRAPVLMTIPALTFFVLPLFGLVLLLVLTPLMRSLSQL